MLGMLGRALSAPVRAAGSLVKKAPGMQGALRVANKAPGMNFATKPLGLGPSRQSVQQSVQAPPQMQQLPVQELQAPPMDQQAMIADRMQQMQAMNGMQNLAQGGAGLGAQMLGNPKQPQQGLGPLQGRMQAMMRAKQGMARY